MYTVCGRFCEALQSQPPFCTVWHYISTPQALFQMVSSAFFVCLIAILSFPVFALLYLTLGYFPILILPVLSSPVVYWVSLAWICYLVIALLASYWNIGLFFRLGILPAVFAATAIGVTACLQITLDLDLLDLYLSFFWIITLMYVSAYIDILVHLTVPFGQLWTQQIIEACGPS